MAAGMARRFEGPKLDVEFSSKRLGRHAVDAALEFDTRNLVIVVGDTCPKFAKEAEAEGIAKLLGNPEARLGLSGSIAVAMRHAVEINCEKLLLRRHRKVCAPDNDLADIERTWPSGVCPQILVQRFAADPQIAGDGSFGLTIAHAAMQFTHLLVG